MARAVKRAVALPPKKKISKVSVSSYWFLAKVTCTAVDRERAGALPHILKSQCSRAFPMQSHCRGCFSVPEQKKKAADGERAAAPEHKFSKASAVVVLYSKCTQGADF